jgi:hypothetical protein
VCFRKASEYACLLAGGTGVCVAVLLAVRQSQIGKTPKGKSNPSRCVERMRESEAASVANGVQLLQGKSGQS